MAASAPTHLIPEPQKLSYEEFLSAYEGVRAEWVDGEVVLVPPASYYHQELVSFLTAVLRVYVETRDLGWVCNAPFQMRLSQIPRGREPDILFVRKERMDLVQSTYLNGPADLVIEITSPESLLRDRGEKFAEYELAGVPEYWLLDPDRKRADFYELGSDGRYRLATLDEEGMYHSQVVQGFWLKVVWLWQDPLPKVLEVVKELGIIA
jgi:Uma2 family endonuclease